MFFAQPRNSGNFRVVDEIFAVAVVRFAVDQHAAIVKHRGGGQNGSRFKIQMMVGPQLVKELQGERLDLLRVLQVAAHAAGEGLRAGEHDLRMFPLLIGKFGRAHLRRGKFVQQALAHSHARRDHLAKTQPPRHGHKNDSRNAHHLGAVPPHGK